MRWSTAEATIVQTSRTAYSMNITKSSCLDCSKSWPNKPTTVTVLAARKRAIVSHIKATGHSVRVYQEIGQDVSTINISLLEPTNA